MKLFSQFSFCLCALLFIATGCSSSDDGSSSSSTTNQVGAAVTLAKSKVTSAVPDTSSVSATSISALNTITGLWTSTSHAMGGDFGNNPRNSIRIHGDKTAQSSLMYRFNQTMTNICLFTQALPTSGTDIALSTGGTITLTAAVKAQLASTCSADVSNLPDGTVVGFKVEDISTVAGSLYDRKVSFDVDGNSTYTEYKDRFYYRFSTTLTRIAYIEDGNNDSAALFEYDSATSIAKFEFSEFSTSFTIHYRVLLLESTDKGYFTAYLKNATDSMKAVVATKEGGGDQIAVSYTFVDDGANDITDGNACVATSNFSIAADNTLTCTGVTGSAASAYTTDHSGINSAYILALAEAANIQFTNATDILTAAKAN